jgi:tetratricopeptide (TPR) repeat protein
MSFSSLLTIIYIASAILTILVSSLALIKHLRSAWPQRRQLYVAGLCLLLFIGVSALFVRGKVFVDKKDLLGLHEIADSAYEAKDYGATVKLMDWAIQFNDNEESFYRSRARAYKRMGDYRKDLEDRKKVFQLNPARELNHLAMIEDFILLKENRNAEAWIGEHENSIKGPDEKTMFQFFDLVCTILEGREYSPQMKEFRTKISQYPLTKRFAEKTWDWQFILTYLEQNPISEQSKATIRGLIQVMKDTAKTP